MRGSLQTDFGRLWAWEDLRCDLMDRKPPQYPRLTHWNDALGASVVASRKTTTRSNRRRCAVCGRMALTCAAGLPSSSRSTARTNACATTGARYGIGEVRRAPSTMPPCNSSFAHTKGHVMGVTRRYVVHGACQRVSYTSPNNEQCWHVEQTRWNLLAQDATKLRVPRVYHAIGPPTQPYAVKINTRANPEYALNYHDATGVDYLRRWCGETVAEAAECLRAPANRADLFRFCALYAEGGVYMDSDMVALRAFDAIVSPCDAVSAGRDVPQGDTPGIQMKILAGRLGHALFRCMLDRIVQNVERRHVPTDAARRIRSHASARMLPECLPREWS